MPQYRTQPHHSKIYEALWVIADERLEVTSSTTARVFSSSRNKFYTVEYDPWKNAIMANDNSSYRVGDLGYPSIALLFKLWALPFNQDYANALVWIKWKDINQKNNNDFDKTIEEVDENVLATQWVDITLFHQYVDDTLAEIKNMKLSYLGEKSTPPKGY